MKNFIIIETTYPNLRGAKSLAKILLQKKLAGCVQFCKISSSYFWEGKIQNSAEILVSIKSKNIHFSEIEKIISDHHPYEIPQIFSKKIDMVSKPYLRWIESNLKSS